MVATEPLTGASVGPYTVWRTTDGKVDRYLVSGGDALHLASLPRRQSSAVHARLEAGEPAVQACGVGLTIHSDLLVRIEHPAKGTRLAVWYGAPSGVPRVVHFEMDDVERRDHFMAFAANALGDAFVSRTREQTRGESIRDPGCGLIIVLLVASLFYVSEDTPAPNGGVGRRARQAEGLAAIGRAIGPEWVVGITAVVALVLVAKAVKDIRRPPSVQVLERRTPAANGPTDEPRNDT